MTHVMTVEAQNESELAKLRGFVEHMGLRIRETHTEDRPSQKELFKRMEEIRLSLQHIKVDPSIDLSALANEAHDTPL